MNDLTTTELARLRHEDGLAEDGDRELLGDADLSKDCLLREHLSLGLRLIEAPSIADAVMRRVASAGHPVADSVIDEGGTPALSMSVMATLGAGDGVGGMVKQAVIGEAGPPPALWDSLSVAVGGECSSGVSGLLKSAVHQEAASGFSHSRGFQTHGPWWKVGVAAAAALAAAAAVLLYLSFAADTGPAVEASIGPEDFEVAE